MKYKDILELKRRIDFNMTYHETLVKLIGKAQKRLESTERLGKMEKAVF